MSSNKDSKMLFYRYSTAVQTIWICLYKASNIADTAALPFFPSSVIPLKIKFSITIETADIFHFVLKSIKSLHEFNSIVRRFLDKTMLISLSVQTLTSFQLFILTCSILLSNLIEVLIFELKFFKEIL